MKLNEREIEEIEALSHYIRYVLTDSQIEEWRVWDAMVKLEKITKIIVERDLGDEDLPDCLKLNEIKEIVVKFLDILKKYVEQPSE